MKNADKPISPAHISIADADGHPFLTSQEGANNGTYTYGSLGLTKREYFAGLAMQGILQNSSLTKSFIAEMAVKMADELLIALEKSTENGSF